MRGIGDEGCVGKAAVSEAELGETESRSLHDRYTTVTDRYTRTLCAKDPLCQPRQVIGRRTL